MVRRKKKRASKVSKPVEAAKAAGKSEDGYDLVRTVVKKKRRIRRKKRRP